MIPRYTRPEMARIWSDENRFRTWLAVEVAATETLAAAGIVPKEAAKAIHARADFSVDRIFQIEAEVKHDVIAFTTAVAEIVGPHARWFHYGLTSNDVVDTAQALLIQQASSLIAGDLERFAQVLERRAWEFKDTPMIGRTHGIHADFLRAVKEGGDPPSSNFPDVSGPYLEALLVGNLAQLAGEGKKVEWDGANMRCTNLPELNQHVRREYRKGWSL